MSNSSLTGLLTNRSRGERGRGKEGYAILQIPQKGGMLAEGDDALNDDFYDEQLRSDGWHLDETSDDEQLDFSLPKALPSKQGNTSCECAPNVATLRRIKSRMSNQCAVM